MSTATAAAAHGVVDGASVPLAKGWGSFQSPSVELLIHQSDDEYRAPPLPPFATDFTIPTHLLPPAPSAADGTDSAGAAADADAVVQPFGRATCLQSLFLLDPVWTFVNHGAFGATLRPMLHVRNQWSEWMERQPLRFLDREVLPLLVHVTREMAALVGCAPTNLTLHANATTALNVIIRSFQMQPQDKILRLSIAYGAVKKMLLSTGGTVVEVEVPLPLRSKQALVDAVVGALDAAEHAGQWRLAVFDHVASNSAVLLPIAELTALCHERGVPVLIDGAHSLGSVPLRLEETGVDFFVSNCHKWLCNPKGAAIMFVAPQHQYRIQPLIISHGTGAGFCSDYIWTGCQDYAPLLSLMSTLRFWQRFGGLERAIRHNHALVLRAGRFLARRWGTEMLVGSADDASRPDSDPADADADSLTANMVCVRLPGPLDPSDSDEHNAVQNALHYDHAIEAPIKVLCSPPRLWVRISAMIYNDMADYERLAEVMWRMRGQGKAPDGLASENTPAAAASSSHALAAAAATAAPIVALAAATADPFLPAEMLHPDHTQVCIPPGAESLALARDFYCNVLQMREVTRPVEMAGRPGLWLRCGSGSDAAASARANVHVGVEALPADHYAKSKAHIAYSVRGLAAWEQRLRQRGCPIVPGLRLPGMERFDSRDPFGNKLEFIEYDTPAPASAAAPSAVAASQPAVAASSVVQPASLSSVATDACPDRLPSIPGRFIPATSSFNSSSGRGPAATSQGVAATAAAAPAAAAAPVSYFWHTPRAYSSEPLLRVAVFQGAAAPGDVERNLEVMHGALERARAGGAQLCLFPELWLSGYDISRATMHSLAVAIDGEPVRRVQSWCRQMGIAACFGYPELGEPEPESESESGSQAAAGSAEGRRAVFNSAVLISEQGNVLLNYRKTHLWMEGEKAIFAAGGAEQLRTVALEPHAVRVGVLICYDVEFPEPSRVLSLQGAHLLLVPTALAKGEVHHTVPLAVVPTRALDNHVWLAYSNLVGRSAPDATADFCGLSGIIGPDGQTLQRLGDGSETASTRNDGEFADLCFSDLVPGNYAKRFETTPLLLDRRAELCQPLAAKTNWA